MTKAEIFSKIHERQVQGMMFHEQMSNYFDFLNLHGFKRLHEYQFFCETLEMRDIEKYYINHENMLIGKSNVQPTSEISDNWHKYNRMQVKTSAKAQAVKEALTKWHDWEKETKELYSQYAYELSQMMCVDSVRVVSILVCDIEEELKRIDRMMIKLENLGYDMAYILDLQDCLHKKYKKKIKKIKL